MPQELNNSQIYALLGERQRRRLLQILDESNTPLPLTEVAKRIGDCESDNLSTEDLRYIQLSLYHTDLPKLEKAGVVEYHENEQTVHFARNFDTLMSFLENVKKADLP